MGLMLEQTAKRLSEVSHADLYAFQQNTVGASAHKFNKLFLPVTSIHTLIYPCIFFGFFFFHY